MKLSSIAILVFFSITTGFCQDQNIANTSEKDLIDIGGEILNAKWLTKHDTLTKKSGRVYFSGAPSLGYSLTSGASAIFVGDFAFFAGELKEQKISIIYFDVLYTQKQQFVFRIQNNLWTKNNTYNIV